MTKKILFMSGTIVEGKPLLLCALVKTSTKSIEILVLI